MFIRVSSHELGRNNITRNGILLKEINNDVQIIIPTSLKSQVIRKAYEREHFSIAKTEALLNKEYWIPNIRDKIQKVIGNSLYIS
jgi:hypothetical protein